MPRRGPAPKKMGPNKKALISKPAPAVPPTPPPPPPAPVQLSGRLSLPASQRDVFDEMMGSEISSDNSSSHETSPAGGGAAAAPEVLRRKSPRFPEVTTTGDGVSDDSSLSMATPDMTARSSASATGASRQNRRKAPAPKKTQTAALREIAKLQGHTQPVVPKLPFARLIREILMEYSHRDLRVTPEMLVCLQESAEIFAVQLMEDAYRCTLHRDRITLMPKDMKLAVMLRKDSVLL